LTRSPGGFAGRRLANPLVHRKEEPFPWQRERHPAGRRRRNRARKKSASRKSIGEAHGSEEDNREKSAKSASKSTARSKVKKAMHERKEGTLKSGRSGKKVTSRKQAIAIGLSEARKRGAKIRRKRGS
jgi:hypothetical protein